jgi:DNA-binding LacI/PurR family transcriptional regulator
VRKLAATAFKTLLARIRYPNNDPREILLDAPLVIRKST